jgi:radical SAM protein with 4Fe4S-binding SPASM domain
MPKIDISAEPKNNKRTHSIMLNITQNCNLQCKYCFENKYTRSNEIMNFDLAIKMIARYMEAEDDFEQIIVDFFGGEPLLAFPLIRQIAEWMKARNWKKQYVFSIGTNGTILTDEMKKWMLENRDSLSVGVSFDGSKKAHNISRDNSFDMVRKNLAFFCGTWPKQPIKMTICAETIPYLKESIIEIEEMGFPFTANIVFENIWGGHDEKRKLLDIYTDQLLQLVDYYTARPELYPVNILDRKIEAIRLKNDKKLDENVKRYCGAGHEMLIVDMDGNVYPCHRFLPWISGRPAPEKIQNRQLNWQPEQCENCILLPICPTCAGYNWELNGDSGNRSTYHCEALKLEVLASAKLQAIKLDQNPPDFKSLTQEEIVILKRRSDAILEINEYGI